MMQKSKIFLGITAILLLITSCANSSNGKEDTDNDQDNNDNEPKLPISPELPESSGNNLLAGKTFLADTLKYTFTEDELIIEHINESSEPTSKYAYSFDEENKELYRKWIAIKKKAMNLFHIWICFYMK